MIVESGMSQPILTDSLKVQEQIQKIAASNTGKVHAVVGEVGSSISSAASASWKVGSFGISEILKFIGMIMTSVVMEYIIFILFILFLLSLLTGSSFMSFKLPNLPVFRLFGMGHSGAPGSGRKWYNVFFPSLNIPVAEQLQRVQGSFVQGIDGFRKRMGGYDNRNNSSAIDRPVVNGRCNDRDWYNLGTQCMYTNVPKSIEWTIPQKNSPEWAWLPSSVQSVVSGKGAKNKVVIPWDIQGSFYVPSCGSAQFADGTSAAHLFKDNGLSCDKLIKMSTKYGKMMRKRKGAKDELIPIREEDCSAE